MAPFSNCSKVSRIMLLYRQQKPATSDSFFSLAFSDDSSTQRTPGPSVEIGFSQKICLFAATQAARCVGRKPGGVASKTTSIPLSSTFWYASRPMNRFASSTFIREPVLGMRCSAAIDFSMLAISMSAIAVSSL